MAEAPSPRTGAAPAAPGPGGLTLIGLASAGHFLNDGYGNVYPALVPLVAAQLGFGLVTGSLLITAVRMASSILQPLFGAAADRRPTPLLGPAALAAAAAATGALGLLPPAPLFVLLAILAGSANGAFHPPGLALVRGLAGGRPGRYTSLFLVGGTVGRALGPLLMVGAAALWGVRGVAALALPGLALAAVLARGARAVPSSARAEREGHGRATLALVRDRLGPLSLLLAVAVARGTVTSAVTTFWPLLHGRAVAEVAGTAGVIAVMMLAGSVGNVLGGSLSDRLPPHRLLAGAAVGAGLSLAAFALAGGAWMYVFAALAGLFAMSTNAVTTVLGQNLLPERVATASGLALGLGNALTAAVTALLAVAAALWGGTVALELAAAVALAGLPAAVAYPRLVRRQRLPIPAYGAASPGA
jgi:FSR family fosmidomycin resistance protein-like MFS transporter